jgi:hypothetical protein
MDSPFLSAVGDREGVQGEARGCTQGEQAGFSTGSKLDKGSPSRSAIR